MDADTSKAQAAPSAAGGMRKVPPQHVLLMSLMWGSMAVFAWLSSWSLLHSTRADTFSYLAAALFFWLLLSFVFHRVAMAFFPLTAGEVDPDSRNERIYNVVHLPFLFFCYYPLLNFRFTFVPLTRLFCIAAGARIGVNTYPSNGLVMDPLFVTLGASVVVGSNTHIVPHVIEGGRLAHFPIHIGDRVTLGVNSVILAGTEIGDDAVVAAGAVVPKFSRIGPGEIWGGLPAKRMGQVNTAASGSPLKSPGPG